MVDVAMDIINEATEMVPVSDLSRHPRNVNQGDVGAIHQSIEVNGFYGALVAQRSTGHVLAGNHRLVAAEQSGAEELPVIWVDVDDDHALRILLADNRTTRLGVDDPEQLADLLQEVLADAGTLDGTGYDGDALDQLLHDLEYGKLDPVDPANDPASEWEGMPEFEHTDLRPHRSLRVHFASDADVEDFMRLIGQEFTDKAKYIWHPALERENFMAHRYANES